MHVQAESDTRNRFIKGYYFLLHLFEILMDEYTCNSQLTVLQLLHHYTIRYIYSKNDKRYNNTI